ncbi:MAG: efflux RND transporter periplasmic adaptor subunit [Huintestinicola sp.]|uniref:efflux RND transporter periplasmic adaptor subunit n=1 Tax=Huintestinicola sp. TaxID=2981661 RepID=UPI003F0AFA67
MKTNKSHKKHIIAAAAVLLAAGAGAAAFAGASASADASEETSYREYTVSKGDITVGAEESGTVSIEHTYVTFPCSAEVNEVYVKEGRTVKEGDPLLKLSPEDIAEAKYELESAVKSAQLELEAAKLDRSTKLLEAKQTLESSLASGSSAETDYDLYLTKNSASKQSSEKQLESLKKELEEYRSMKETYPDDYAELCKYEDKLEEYEAKYKEMENIYKSYQKTDDENSSVLDEIQSEYDEYIEKISDTSDRLTELKKNYEEAKAAYDKALEDYETALENYEKASSNSDITITSENSSDSSSGTSSSSGSATDLAEKLSQAKAALDSASNAYNSANVAYSGYYQNLDSQISDKIEEYESRISEAKKTCSAHEKITQAYKKQLDEFNEEVSDCREQYEDEKADFTEIYGQNDDETIDERIDALTDSIAEAELSIETAAAGEEGDLLKARQQADSALAQAESAQAVYDRTVASIESETEKAQKNYDKALEEYNDFCESVSDDGVVYAECDGMISSVNVSEGSSVMANNSLITILDTRYVYLSASVSEEDITSLETDMECSVSLTAYENKTFDGHIDTISAEPARSSGSVTYTVTVKLEDESGLNVREGMSGEITFIEGGVSDVMYTNVNAITFRDGVSYVKMYDENGQITEKEVVTGFSDGRYVEIKEGVLAGDKVLAEIELAGK